MSNNSYYNINGVNAFQPVGSIIQYLGSSDPPGWVICDGVARTNNSDKRYNKLYEMGIGIGGNETNSYTPPDLRNKYLFSKTVNTSIGSIGGTGTVNLSPNNLPTHNHYMYHAHFGAFQGGAGSNGVGFAIYNTETRAKLNSNLAPQQNGIVTSGPKTFVGDTNGISYSNTDKINTDPPSFSPTGIDITPLSFKVNYLLKY